MHDLGPIGYATYHYEGIDFQPPIILNGKLYYNVESLPREGWRCLDLYTGEELYFRNTTGPVVGVGATFDFSGSSSRWKIVISVRYTTMSHLTSTEACHTYGQLEQVAMHSSPLQPTNGICTTQTQEATSVALATFLLQVQWSTVKTEAYYNTISTMTV